MEYSQDYLEIKKQLFDLIEMSNKSIEAKTITINKELSSLKQGNTLIYLKIKDLLEKIDTLSFRTNTTLVTEVSSQLVNNSSLNTKQHKRMLNKSGEGKINIQNLVINKKVQIGRDFSKLNISNISTSPNKSMNYPIDNHLHPPTRNVPNINPKKKQSIIKMRIFSKNKCKEQANSRNEIPTTSNGKLNGDKLHNNNTIKSYNNSHSESALKEDIDNMNNTIHQFSKKKSPNKIDITLKTSKSINDIRKFSIMDIPSIDIKELPPKGKKKKEKSMRNYLYSKKHKFYYVLAKQNILPLKLRLIFAKRISNFYSKEEVYADYYDFVLSNYNHLIAMKQEYQPFLPSLTSQVSLNFITGNDEKNCINMISPKTNNNKNNNSSNNDDNNNHQLVSQTQLNSFYSLLIVFYYLINEPINDSLPKDAYNLFNDLLTRVIKKTNSTSIKNHQLESIKTKLVLTPSQVAHIQKIYNDVINKFNFKPFDKVSSVMLFFLKDFNEYSLLKMSDGNAMVQYNYTVVKFEKLKAELEEYDA